MGHQEELWLITSASCGDVVSLLTVSTFLNSGDFTPYLEMLVSFSSVSLLTLFLEVLKDSIFFSLVIDRTGCKLVHRGGFHAVNHAILLSRGRDVA